MSLRLREMGLAYPGTPSFSQTISRYLFIYLYAVFGIFGIWVTQNSRPAQAI